ncbi:hypothetical protein BDK92_0348 [Micromonospora pisi]|uniref:Uncharacterized protein n=1 Tax=Micromonospora pisi TaxID=589240 RepID=A0A495JAT8_9ACTN|nr:hypothetical protein [Micromonospora pisi]RKR86126.1 hypothetical protein BDK92_0348 [Micromonospora pisi]
MGTDTDDNAPPPRPERPAPDSSGLHEVTGFPFPVYVSDGGVERGQFVAERVQRVAAWLSETVGTPPTPPLFVVGPRDWPRVGLFSIYGVVHVSTDRMVIGQEPSPMWDALLDNVVPTLSQQTKGQLHALYGDPIDLAPLNDLFVAHEMSHLSHDFATWEDPVNLWLWEFIANVGMVGYFSEVETEMLPTLEAAEVFWSAPVSWPVRELARMREPVEGHGLGGVANYLWFEFGLVLLAQRLWKNGGPAAFRRLCEVSRGPELTPSEVLAMLDDIDPDVAQAVRDWPN